MPNFKNGKIYKIQSIIGNCVYYGSTTKKNLSDRFSGHKYCYKRNQKAYTSSKVLQYDDAKIILVEAYPCNNKSELTSRECYYIKNNECVNKQIPGRTDKQYRIDNKEKILKRSKQYRKDHKHIIYRQCICECGIVYTYQHKSRHLKSEYHINKITNPFYYTNL